MGREGPEDCVEAGGAHEARPPVDVEPCWVLAGPTASGKTAVALCLAQTHPVEIVSVDSMQVYRGMDIGTAKPSPQELAAAPHHMVDVLDPEQSCNVGLFCSMALDAIAGIRRRGNKPLLVAGTPLYLKALLWGLMEGPAADPALRRALHAQARDEGPASLHARLAEVDPEAARRIHPNDVHRLVRALEVHEMTGGRISRQQTQFEGSPRLAHVLVGLRWPRAELYARIEHRVDDMMRRGLLSEVHGLRARLGRQARQALGYRELLRHLGGELTLPEAVGLAKRNTRRFAKHQLTWLRHFPSLRWVDAQEHASPSRLAARCASLFVQPS